MADIGGATTASGPAKVEPGSERPSSTAASQPPSMGEDGSDRASAQAPDPGEPAELSTPDEAGSTHAYRKRRGRPSRARGQPNSSDAPSARWTIRGVPPHIRDMALKAAEARGMTVGDWIAEAIVGFVRGSGKAAPAAEQRSNLPTTETPPDLVDMMARLDARLTRLEDRQTLGFFGRLFGRRR
jgi:hypothetical protein